MDTMMPVLDGFEAAREIRRREHTTGRHVPIIAVTGIAAVDQRFVGKSENAEAECIRSGMDECTQQLIFSVNRHDDDTWLRFSEPINHSCRCAQASDHEEPQSDDPQVAQQELKEAQHSSTANSA